jgi:hypothetical protein
VSDSMVLKQEQITHVLLFVLATTDSPLLNCMQSRCSVLISIVELHTVALFYNFDGGLRDDNDGCALGQPVMVLSGQEVCLGFIHCGLGIALAAHASPLRLAQ